MAHDFINQGSFLLPNLHIFAKTITITENNNNNNDDDDDDHQHHHLINNDEITTTRLMWQTIVTWF